MKINEDLTVTNSYNQTNTLRTISNRAYEWDLCKTGYVLWNNPNPETSFSGQSININLQGCFWFKIIYKINATGAECIIVEIPFPGMQIRSSATYYGVVAQRDVSCGRSIYVHSNGQIDFSDGCAYGIEGSNYLNTSQNDMMVPLRIVGYKNAWNNG